MAAFVIPSTPGGIAQLGVVIPPEVGPSDVRYEWKEGFQVLGGLLAWGRVNRKRYIQVLWIPIPVGNVKLPGTS